MTSTGHRAAVRPTPIANPAPARNPFDDGSAGPALWRGPGDEAQEMHEEISRMMQRMSSRFVEMESLLDFDRGWNALMMSPTMDMRDHGDSYVLDFSLPGMDASKIEISLEGRLLTVNTSVEEQGSAARRFGRFERKVLLPGPVGDASSARAMMTNGVLKVIIPKAGEPKAEVKPGRIFPSERFDNRGHSIPGNTY
jgi:HSP20 family protein